MDIIIFDLIVVILIYIFISNKRLTQRMNYLEGLITIINFKEKEKSIFREDVLKVTSERLKEHLRYNLPFCLFQSSKRNIAYSFRIPFSFLTFIVGEDSLEITNCYINNYCSESVKVNIEGLSIDEVIEKITTELLVEIEGEMRIIAMRCGDEI